MDQRVADLFHHGLVELGFLAGELEVDLLAQALREIARHAREAAEHETDGQHAHAHDAFLQAAHVALEAARGSSGTARHPGPSSFWPSWLSMACVMTSSPTVFMSSSIFSTLTRMEPESPTVGPAFGLGRSGFLDSGLGRLRAAATGAAGSAAGAAASGACATSRRRIAASASSEPRAASSAASSCGAFLHRTVSSLGGIQRERIVEVAIAFRPIEHFADRLLASARLRARCSTPGSSDCASSCIERRQRVERRRASSAFQATPAHEACAAGRCRARAAPCEA